MESGGKEKIGTAKRIGVNSKRPLQPGAKPHLNLFKGKRTICNRHDQIINRLIIGDCQIVTTTFDKNLYNKPSSSLVTVHKSMIANHALK